MTPNRLLRLYPGLWRLRYGREFLALLDARPLTGDIIVDVLRHAAHEWLARTRTGRLLLGCALGVVAALASLAMNRVVSAEIIGVGRIDSFAEVLLGGFVGSLPLVVGAVLIVARTHRTNRYAWLGLGYQALALCVAAAWSQWSVLGWATTVAAESGPTWWVIFRASVQPALMVTWMLLLLFNVDRRHERFYAWRGFGSRIGGDEAGR